MRASSPSTCSAVTSRPAGLPDPVRLFVAITIPEGHRRALAARLATVAARGPRARWERPEKLHLTLCFLGEVGAQRQEALATGLREAISPLAPFPARLTAAGAFPGARRARVLWLGVEAGEPLARLQAAVEEVCRPFAERAEARVFHPHLTLARCDPPWSGPALERFVAELGAPAPEPFRVFAASLVESRLGPGGSQHREIAVFPLAGEGEGGAGEEGRRG